jgi:nucleotide-binding universal stress UspA family protein
MYESILFPTDGSTGSEAAMKHALDIASTYGATVHVLHVVDSDGEMSHLVNDDDAGGSGMVKPDDVDELSGMIATDEDVQKLERAARQVVGATAEEMGDRGVETVTEVRRGNPYRTILNYAGDEGIDLIVMPTHGRRGIDRYLLGSVTEKVVRTSDVPVLTVRIDEEG